MKAKVAIPYMLVAALALGAFLPGTGVSVTSPAVAATSPDELMEDPELERRARALSKELRCLVCQNQSIDDSDADLARDLRRLVRERLLEGGTDDEIIDFVTKRYGDFVLLRPPIKPSTWILWYGPPVLMVFAGIAVFTYLRRRRNEPVAAPVGELSDEEQATLDRLLQRQTSDRT